MNVTVPRQPAAGVKVKLFPVMLLASISSSVPAAESMAVKPEMANVTPANAAVLTSAGIKTAICTDHSEIPIEYLPVSVGIAMKAGLTFEKALESVTVTAAEIAGISDITGSLEPRKRADMVLFSGMPFEIMSDPALVISGGRAVKNTL